MDKDTRNAIERATQQARQLLEEDFATQLEGVFDVHRDGVVAMKAGSHLSARQVFQRDRIVAAIDHKRAAGMSAADAVADYLRDAAFTTLNRFVALRMLEARDLVQQCIAKGELSVGYKEFTQDAGTSRNGIAQLPDDAGYRLYIECLFDELATEVKVLFDRRDPSSVLWPKRATFEQLLEILNSSELSEVWGEDETIGWVYQFFNGQDERRRMRDESQAPRNSRELAVRNQFFTPRYVVQFLTDNTLGRIWYEMRGSKTVLAGKCEYMVHKPGEELAPRAKKDPRDLRVLDPACGSGHFLLYAFDILLVIYAEAFADPDSPRSEATGKTLAEDYPSIDALNRAVPGLALAHNLHGVDIDPRCAQIAQLALWMRAQKAYRDFGVGRFERAHIRRSNIVVAEPLVADDQIAKEFVAKLGDAELGRVFTSLIESLNLAGDMGLLLRVEKLVKSAKRQGELFAPPEERIRAALDRFVREEAGATSTRRRLFTDDAAQGVALLGVAEKKFHVVLMNPPFGAGSMCAKKDFEKAYPRTKNDVYAAFIERSLELIQEDGRVGALTSRTGFFLKSFREWREETLLADGREMILADLGIGVLDDAMVETAAYTIGKAADSTFIRLTSEASKADALRTAATQRTDGGVPNVYRFSLQEFRAVEGTPFSYWISPSVRRLFRQLPRFESDDRFARLGASTKDDFRFLRLWWEVPLGSIATTAAETDQRRWVTFAKGGPSTPFYSELGNVVNWAHDGCELKAFIGAYRESHGWGDHWRAELHNSDFYFREGITWPLRAGAFCPQALPGGCIFSVRGYAVFAPSDQLLSLVGLLASNAFDYLFKSLLGRFGFPEFVVGALQKLPVPKLSAYKDELGRLAHEGWLQSRALAAGHETAREFVPGVAAARQPKEELEAKLAAISARLDALGLAAYGLSSSDVALAIEVPTSENGERSTPEAEEDEPPSTQSEPGTASISWVVGVAFGRFDPRLATGDRAAPPQPEPFDALPSHAPGMYPEGEHPERRVDILVDDEGHADDLAARARAVAERVHVDVPENLRAWLAKDFLPLHIKMYSRSRRKAPIYWQLATPSASYSVWLYVQACSKDTIFRVQNDYVVPKLGHEERRLESFTRELRDKASAAQRKELAAQEAAVEELRTFLDEVKRIAPLWSPNLDDGVIINFAPLWRLVPQNKLWQKELKSTWDALCEGRFDWSHLAMHLWPERVVPTCAKDRSLAIAHGFEDVFWVEGSDRKWRARKTPTRSIDELVRERTSPAVKAALKTLLEAPSAGGNGNGKNSKKGKRNA